MMPGVVHEPETPEEACEVLAGLARAGHACVFIGGGTKLGLGAAPSRLDAVVRTGKLARIVEYSPADQVVTAEAGVTLGALQARLAGERQRLSLDPPWPARATLGGIVASNAFGPLRARSGSVRDLILGVSLVRADGVLARGGGKVVKNVAGFDLPKLACGSLGTLGMIAQLTLRVHPLPETTEVCTVRGLPASGVVALLRSIRAAQLEPAALLALQVSREGRERSSWDVALRFEGFGPGVARQVEALGGLARVEETALDPFEAHRRAREAATVRIKVAALPTALGEVEAALAPIARVLSIASAELAWYPTLGIGFFSAVVPESPTAPEREGLAAGLSEARRAIAAIPGSLTVEAAPPSLLGAVPTWEAPPSLFLHQAVKSRFDPRGLLAPGRFVGGL
jgi:glycolate oxidase FAD binding subunit